MIRKILTLVGVCFLLSLLPGPARAQTAIPAATQSQIECSGFITSNWVPTEAYVFDGADNDFRSHFHQFRTGEYVYLRGGKGSMAPGNEYRVVRPATGAVFEGNQVPIFGRATWYPGQERSIGSLGEAYEDVGRVKVAAVTALGGVAEVTFACGPIVPHDIAIPFQAREIPTYDPTAKVDRFAPLGEAKKTGAITASHGNAGALGSGDIAYVNLGEVDGAHAGQRYRIFHVDRDVYGLAWGFKGYRTPPTETVGELVILFTQEKSSVGIVISNVREINLGDGVALE